jgi:hypothetical protein
MGVNDLILIFGVLMPLSAIFLLYHGDQFYLNATQYPNNTEMSLLSFQKHDMRGIIIII